MSNDLAKAFEEVISTRRSIRGFSETPVEQQLLDHIFSIAQHSPSNCNTQPWKVAVVSGERLKALSGKLMDAMAKGEMTMDFPYDGKYDGVYQERQYGSAAALYSALEIPREDKAGRNIAFMRNFECFGAPHAAFLFLPGEFGIREAADLGMYAQSLMLALNANGIGSCPQTALSFSADVVRSELGIDENFKLLFGISFGYPDDSHLANRCRTDRAEVSDVADFYS